MSEATKALQEALVNYDRDFGSDDLAKKALSEWESFKDAAVAGRPEVTTAAQEFERELKETVEATKKLSTLEAQLEQLVEELRGVDIERLLEAGGVDE